MRKKRERLCKECGHNIEASKGKAAQFCDPCAEKRRLRQDRDRKKRGRNEFLRLKKAIDKITATDPERMEKRISVLERRLKKLEGKVR